jgi:SAM-dependent methyltransferase
MTQNPTQTPSRENTMTHTLDPLKTTHRAMWALGDYPSVAIDLIPALGPALVSAARVRPGERVLDVAAGAGNTAVPAAMTGAIVTAADLTPELFPAGRAFAARHGVVVDFEEADAEALPYPDGAFDKVLSSIGVMFAPHHRRAADELVRVCRPGGTVGLLNWTVDGFVGAMFRAMRPYVPAPPPDVQPAALWGDEDYVRALFGDRVSDVVVTRASVLVDRFATPEAWLAHWKRVYGPTIAAYRGLADDPARTAALDADLLAVARAFDRGGEATVLDWEYLVLTACVRE